MPQFIKRIHMHAHASLQLGERLGRATLEINGSGNMIMSFGPRISLEPWSIRILGVDLTFEPFRLPHPSNQPNQHIEMERLQVTNADFDLPRCHGRLNRQTGEVSLHLEIVLRPDRFPQLWELGINEPLHILVNEEGHMDFVQGRIIQTHARTFQIPSNLPEGLLEVRAGQHSCEAVGHLFVAVAGSNATVAEIERYQPDKAWLCPSSHLILAWQIDNYPNAAKAQITGGNLSTPISVQQNPGSTNPIPAPNANATYTLEVEDTNGCKNQSSVDVFVITSGQHIDIQARKSQPQIWSAQFPAVQFDPKIRVTSIASKLCSGEETAYADWSLYKTDPNGSVHALNVTPTPSPLSPFPLAGVYSFSPIDTGYFIVDPSYNPEFPSGPPPIEENYACFDATMDCQ